jgi:hypothetical protein
MESQIRELAKARVTLANSKEQLSVLEKQLLDNPIYIQLKATVGETSATVSQMEEAVRSAALESFRADGNKKPHPAVSIKIFQTTKILDEDAAREWCFANFRPALKLDAKTFEKAAKDGNVPAELVTIGEDPRAQIATDLDEYLFV